MLATELSNASEIVTNFTPGIPPSQVHGLRDKSLSEPSVELRLDTLCYISSSLFRFLFRLLKFCFNPILPRKFDPIYRYIRIRYISYFFPDPPAPAELPSPLTSSPRSSAWTQASRSPHHCGNHSANRSLVHSSPVSPKCENQSIAMMLFHSLSSFRIP